VGAVTGGIGVIFAGVLMPIAFTLLGWIPLWLALIIVIILIYLGFELLKRGFE
jgi:cell shape-determining protein MreD